MSQIFEHFTNPNFFKPLTYKHRQVYCDAIEAILRAAAEKSPLHEKDARREIEEIIINTYGLSELPGEDAESSLDQYTVYKQLRYCGWIDDSYVGNNGRPEVILNPDAVNLVAFLHDVAKGATGVKESDIHAISDAAKRLAEGIGRPVQDIIPEIERRIQSLTNALISLRTSIRKITSDFIQQRPLKEVIEFFIDKEVDALFEDYQYLRENGYGLQFFIDTKAHFDEFEMNEERMSAAASEYARINNIEEAEAREAIEGKIRSFGRFVQYDYRRLTSEVDKKINDCNKAITAQLIMNRRFGRDNHDLLVELLDLLKLSDKKDCDEVLDMVSSDLPLFSMEYVSSDSLEPRESFYRKSDRVAFIEESSISDEVLAKKAEQFANESESRIRVAKEYIEKGLSERNRFVPDKSTVKSWEKDATTIADIIAAAGNCSDAFPYKILVTDEIVETDCARFNSVVIERR